MKKQYAMVIDSSKCVDCKGCVVACKIENEVPHGFSRNWIKVEQPDFSDPDWMSKKSSSHFQPGGCMHCSNPTCVDACPTGATYRDENDGTIRVDEELCIGCSSCIGACPYGARYKKAEANIVDKCDFCADRRDNNQEPTCVETCLTRARVFGDINDQTSAVYQLLNSEATVTVTNSKTDTRPNMYYITKTAPMNWTKPAEIPTPYRIWHKVANPFVMAFTGLNSLAVLAMLGRQFLDRKNRVQKESSNKGV
jgi:Fe-S-cluster-containing dehydrogenase component